MKKDMNRLFFPFSLLSILIFACSAETNPLAKVSLGRMNDVENLLNLSEMRYDKGDFEGALTYAQMALELDPQNQRGSLMMGFVHFSMAGMDPFRLASKLMDKTESKKGQTLHEEADILLADGKESSNSEMLSNLNDLLGVTQAEYDGITLEGNSVVLVDGSVVKGAPDSGVFKEYPVILPKTATLARSAGTPIISHLTAGIRHICPLVIEEVKIPEDPRHSPDNCHPVSNTVYARGKAHFLWAFLHLTEAVIFKTIVLYDPEGKGANIIRRSDAIKAQTSMGFLDYLKAVRELSAVMDVIFPTDEQKSRDSMLTAIINDLTATSLAFTSMKGIPPSMTEQVTSTLNSINEKRNKMATAGAGTAGQSGVNSGSKALKEQLTAKIAQNVGSQMAERYSKGEMTEANRKEACDVYAGITSTEIDICKTK
ncbi:MAG: tetratricopeptide repeat protein [Oligoflexales bacterium]|nr:tetratricopeptide repeat protein [Oligoflexales bacterium]